MPCALCSKLRYVFCLVMAALVFQTCENKADDSNYPFGCEVAPQSGAADSLITEFMQAENGHVLIYNEMKKTADQFSDVSRTCIWKASREKAVQSAREAFAAGMDAVRRDSTSFRGMVIRLYMIDPDINDRTVIGKDTI